MTLFLEPRSVEEAVEAFASHPDARLLSGGATLVAMMNAGLAEPPAVISLKRIESLSGISVAAGGEVTIGGMTRHKVTAESDVFRGGQRVVPFAARRIASPPVRNMGTIGGSIGFSDPAADYPAALVAAEARVETIGPSGRRIIEAGDFFLDWYTTALDEGEIVIAVHVPPAPGAGAAYEKLVKTEGDMGIATVAAVVEVDGGTCRSLRVAVGACGPHPVRLKDAEQALVGGKLAEDALDELGAALAARLDPVDDVRASADYRRLVVPRMVRKAVEAARRAAEAGQ